MIMLIRCRSAVSSISDSKEESARRRSTAYRQRPVRGLLRRPSLRDIHGDTRLALPTTRGSRRPVRREDCRKSLERNDRRTHQRGTIKLYGFSGCYKTYHHHQFIFRIKQHKSNTERM